MRAAAAAAIVAAMTAVGIARDDRELGRETLAAGDGWAAFSTGTAGGAAAGITTR